MLNTVVPAPIPIASTAATRIVKPGVRAIPRIAFRPSCSRASKSDVSILYSSRQTPRPDDKFQQSRPFVCCWDLLLASEPEGAGGRIVIDYDGLCRFIKTQCDAFHAG